MVGSQNKQFTSVNLRFLPNISQEQLSTFIGSALEEGGLAQYGKTKNSNPGGPAALFISESPQQDRSALITGASNLKFGDYLELGCATNKERAIRFANYEREETRKEITRDREVVAKVIYKRMFSFGQ